MSEDIRNQINDDINLIYNLMVDNKNRIQELEKQLKTSGIEKGRLNKLIENLTLELKERSEQIARLNELLIDKDLEIEQLSESVENLTSSLVTIREINRQTKDELESTKDLYNTAYYAIGTKKELKDKKIIDRQGFLFFGSKRTLPEGFDKQYFQTIDVRNTTSISITGKKAKLLTRHPNNSYKLVNESKGNITLDIFDSELFWSINKYLVVQVN
jgi:seryl-tRNA synthetase